MSSSPNPRVLDISRLSKDKPLLLVDVDGVVNCINSSRSTKTYSLFNAEIDGASYPIRLSHKLPGLLARLAESYHLVWCTMWDDWANTHLVSRLNLPSLPYLPVADGVHSAKYTPTRNGKPVHLKVPEVETYVGDRPFAWIDDGFDRGDFAWATVRDTTMAPTYLLGIQPGSGLQGYHVDKLLKWADGIK